MGLLDHKERIRSIVREAATGLKAFPSLKAAVHEDARGVFERRAEDLLRVAEAHPLAPTLTADQINSEVVTQLKYEVLTAEINRVERKNR